MTRETKRRTEIWTLRSEIWPDFAKSGICPKSEIWTYLLISKGLMPPIQISARVFRNLIRNLDFHNNFNSFRKISDFGKSPP